MPYDTLKTYQFNFFNSGEGLLDSRLARGYSTPPRPHGVPQLRYFLIKKLIPEYTYIVNLKSKSKTNKNAVVDKDGICYFYM